MKRNSFVVQVLKILRNNCRYAFCGHEDVPTLISGTSLYNNGSSNPVVLRGLSLVGRKVGDYSFTPRVGRYVHIRLVGRNRVLTLCEVQVYGLETGNKS